ncbi:MAG: hypothetical protein WCS87_09480 [Methylococcaceae bacterium]
METYLPIIKALFSEWTLLTLANPVYAGAVAVVVWLLTASIYSIKIASLKKKNVASEKARIEMQDKLNAELNAVQQQMQQMQGELAANTEQMQKDRQLAQHEAERAVKAEEQLSLRNKQIAEIIQTLATSFDLGERPLPVMGDLNAEDLWQQHDRVINLLTTRLRSEQQAKSQLQQSYQDETVKRLEKEAVIDTLQATLATQTSQFAKLEQTLEEQKSTLQQQQAQAQQVLSQTLEKHLSELARLTELEQQALELVNTRQQIAQLEEKLTAKEALIIQLEQTKPVEPVKVPAPPQPAPIKPIEQETVIELKQAPEEIPPVVVPAPVPAAAVIEQPPVIPVKEKMAGVTGKLTNLFGKKSQEPVKAAPEVAEIKKETPEIQSAPLVVEQPPVVAEQPPVTAAKSQFGKLTNLFGKKSQEPIKAAPEVVEIKQHKPEIQPVPLVVEQPSVTAAKGQFGKLKNLFGKTSPEPIKAAPDVVEIKQVEEKIQPAPVTVTVETLPLSAAKNPFRNKKYFFGDIDKLPEEPKQDEVKIQPAPEVQLPVSPAKSQLTKLKSLFSKSQ